MDRSVVVISDRRMLEHVNGPGHPERPDRLRTVLDDLDAVAIVGVDRREPEPASLETLTRVHDRRYVEAILAHRGQSIRLDPDTSMSPGSVDAVLLGAGAAIAAVEAVCTEPATAAFALVRPPGHHAERDRAMGFCLFNNIAVAAAHARAALGCARVLIVDWDVHHGNGTQHTFESDPSVLFFGSHRAPPFYPGTGGINEVGRGPGEGYTVNLPLPAGIGDALMVALYTQLLPPIAEAFAPDLVLVSAGFDAHADDPLGGLRMTDTGFAALCAIVQDVAHRHAKGKLALILEGGYDCAALTRGVRACLQVLKGNTPPPMPPELTAPEAAIVASYRRRHGQE